MKLMARALEKLLLMDKKHWVNKLLINYLKGFTKVNPFFVYVIKVWRRNM